MPTAAATAYDSPVTYFSSQRSGTSSRAADGDILTVTGLKVFRVGSFKDSKGRRHTIAAADLDQMVDNFTKLREDGIFVDVPVRADHSDSVSSLAGYFTALRHEGDFLVCDIEFTEPDHAAKYERGTYRSRSLEVATYEDNDGNRYSPVVQGLAFVDLPAVEGLFTRQRGAGEIVDPKETVVPTENLPEPATFRMRGVPTTDIAVVQSYIDELEARPATAPVKFRMGGVEETDPAKIQTSIDAYEAAFTTMRTDGRAEFVKALATAGKITAPQVDDLTAHVQTLNDEQYASFSKFYDAAPGSGLFQKHGGALKPGAPADPANDALDEREVLEAQVSTFRRAGRSEKWIEGTKAFSQLAAMTAAGK